MNCLLSRSTWVHPQIFSGVRVTRSLVLCVCFVDRCLSFFPWSSCCLSFFDLWILVTLLISSNSSCNKRKMTAATRRPGTVHPSGAPEFTPEFLLWFVCSILSILCSVLWIITLSFYSFDHCIICSLIDDISLPPWNLSTFLIENDMK